MTSAYRTVRWQPPVPSFITQAPLRLPDRCPLDYDDVSLDIGLWLLDAGDTIAAVQSGTTQPGLQVIPATPAFSGTTCTVYLRGGIIGTVYTIDFVVTTTGGLTKDFPVLIKTVAGLGIFPTSPLLLAAGAYWYNAFRAVFLATPVWATLPTTQQPDADEFWWSSGILMLPTNSTLLPMAATGLNLGDIWNNAGVVTANGNPGLPTAASVSGTIWYRTDGSIGLSP